MDNYKVNYEDIIDDKACGKTEAAYESRKSGDLYAASSSVSYGKSVSEAGNKT